MKSEGTYGAYLMCVSVTTNKSSCVKTSPLFATFSSKVSISFGKSLIFNIRTHPSRLATAKISFSGENEMPVSTSLSPKDTVQTAWPFSRLQILTE